MAALYWFSTESTLLHECVEVDAEADRAVAHARQHIVERALGAHAGVDLDVRVRRLGASGGGW